MNQKYCFLIFFFIQFSFAASSHLLSISEVAFFFKKKTWGNFFCLFFKLKKKTLSCALVHTLHSFCFCSLLVWCALGGWLVGCFRRCASPLRNERFRGRLLRRSSLGMRSAGNERRNPSSEIWQCEILTNFLSFSARVRICFVFVFFSCWFGSSSLAFHSFLCVS